MSVAIFLRDKTYSTGFTLIELLVAVSIIGLLSSLVFASVNKARGDAKTKTALQFVAQNDRIMGDEAIGIWNFEEGSGTMTKDSSGWNKNASIYGATFTTDTYNIGVSKYALSFDGANDVVVVGTGNTYFPLPLFSMSAWVKTPGLGTGMSKCGIIALTYGLGMDIDAQGRFIAYLHNALSGGVAIQLTTTENLFDNKFHHLVFGYDGKNMNVYIDGQEKGTRATTWPGTTPWAGNGANIGRNNNNNNTFFSKVSSMTSASTPDPSRLKKSKNSISPV